MCRQDVRLRLVVKIVFKIKVISSPSASSMSIFGIFNPSPRVHDLSSDFLTTPACQLKITMEAVRIFDYSAEEFDILLFVTNIAFAV